MVSPSKLLQVSRRGRVATNNNWTNYLIYYLDLCVVYNSNA